MMKHRVYLGFLDEMVEDKHKGVVNYTTNKVGGKPNWIDNKQITSPLCKNCGFILPLIVQIYGPLEQSKYHRTLYVFGCINPNCWNKHESWVCLRSQVLDDTIQSPAIEENKDTVNSFDWCDGAGDWEDNRVESMTTDQTVEELSYGISMLNSETVTSASNNVFLPTAEIEEDDKDEMVYVDEPLEVQTDLVSLIHQVNPKQQVPPETLEFTSFFISVVEEDLSKANHVDSSLPLINTMLESNEETTCSGADNKETTEAYEKAVPRHGDKMFHRFITTIQKNPGQILRYLRDGGAPMFFYPANNLPQRCEHCSGSLVFELQLLPTLVYSLQLVGNGSGHIEFGTVFVLACKNSCWAPEDTTRFEYVYVQRELM